MARIPQGVCDDYQAHVATNDDTRVRRIPVWNIRFAGAKTASVPRLPRDQLMLYRGFAEQAA